MLLTNAAYVHLKHLNVSKHTRNLLPASRAILLSGPAGMPSSTALIYIYVYPPVCLYNSFIVYYGFIVCSFIRQELYHQMLAKALSHYFEAKLLLLDVNDLSLKVIMATLATLSSVLIILCTHICMVAYPQIQSKYGSSKKESVSQVPLF